MVRDVGGGGRNNGRRGPGLADRGNQEPNRTDENMY